MTRFGAISTHRATEHAALALLETRRTLGDVVPGLDKSSLLEKQIHK